MVGYKLMKKGGKTVKKGGEAVTDGKLPSPFSQLSTVLRRKALKGLQRFLKTFDVFGNGENGVFTLPKKIRTGGNGG